MDAMPNERGVRDRYGMEGVAYFSTLLSLSHTGLAH